jgi:hypothetical protein
VGVRGGRLTVGKPGGRIRDPNYLALVHLLPCLVAVEIGSTRLCSGGIEADHEGWRPLGRKCNDDETVPLCSKHHAERGQFAGYFRTFDRARMRAWRAAAIAWTRERVARLTVAPVGEEESMELNPDHPVTKELHDQWHKMLALVLVKLGIKEIVLREKDVQRGLNLEGGLNVVCRAHPDALRITLVSDEEAQRLAAENRS